MSFRSFVDSRLETLRFAAASEETAGELEHEGEAYAVACRVRLVLSEAELRLERVCRWSSFVPGNYPKDAAGGRLSSRIEVVHAGPRAELPQSVELQIAIDQALGEAVLAAALRIHERAEAEGWKPYLHHGISPEHARAALEAVQGGATARYFIVEGLGVLSFEDGVFVKRTSGVHPRTGERWQERQVVNESAALETLLSHDAFELR